MDAVEFAPTDVDRCRPPGPTVGTTAAAARSMLLPVGGDWYLIALDEALEVIVDPVATELPGAPAVLLGVVNVRGAIVPLLDTARLLGAGRLGPCTTAVVVDTDWGAAALAGSAPVTGVPRDALTAAGPPQAFGVPWRVDGRAVVRLDIAGLVTPTNIAGRH